MKKLKKFKESFGCCAVALLVVLHTAACSSEPKEKTDTTTASTLTEDLKMQTKQMKIKLQENYDDWDMVFVGQTLYLIAANERESDEDEQNNIYDTDIYRYDFEKDLPQLVFSGELGRFGSWKGLSVSEDLFYIYNQFDILKFELETFQEKIEIHDPKTNFSVHISISSDGKNVAYADENQNTVVSPMDRLTQKTVVFPASTETVWTPDGTKLVQLRWRPSLLAVYDFGTGETKEHALDFDPIYLHIYDDTSVICGDENAVYFGEHTTIQKIDFNTGKVDTIYESEIEDQNKAQYVAANYVFFIKDTGGKKRICLYDFVQDTVIEDKHDYFAVYRFSMSADSSKVVFEAQKSQEDDRTLFVLELGR